jgi:hypothetical protein
MLEIGAMTLTRRRLKTQRFESWGIYKGDLQVGTISAGIGTNGDQIWRWSCGFYPGCDAGERSEGIQPTYDEAKTEFEKAWERLEPQITADMAEEWLKNQAWTAWKYEMWEAGCKIPAQTQTGRSKCFCGVEITAETTPGHVYDKHTTTKNPYRS